MGSFSSLISFHVLLLCCKVGPDFHARYGSATKLRIFPQTGPTGADESAGARRDLSFVEDEVEAVAHVSGEFSVGADQGDAVGHGLGDDQAVVGVAVVIVEREGGEH